MSTLMPGAEWRPLSCNFTRGGVTRPPRGLVVHTEVTPATLTANDACWRYLNNPAVQVSAYFLNGIDGHIIQAVDLDDRAWTQAAGNRDWVGAENAGDGTKFGFTAEQIDANAHELAFLHTHYGVPLQLAHSPSDRGLGYHAMGGVPWGNHPCPGSFVIAQLPTILARAVLFVDGGHTPHDNPPPPIVYEGEPMDLIHPKRSDTEVAVTNWQTKRKLGPSQVDAHIATQLLNGRPRPVVVPVEDAVFDAIPGN